MILKRFTKDTRIIFNLTMVLMAGGCAFFVLKKIIQKHGQQSRNCKVTLYGKEMLEVNALLDTGNSLQEPISGKAVAILDKKVFEKVFPDKQQEGFRAIPYHSIGKKHGILPGYLLEHIRVETEDGFKECREIYVGISEEIMSENNDYKMILNPRILERKG